MAATLQHACNRRSDTEQRLFKNDANNVAALQNARQQKKRMEEAALLQQKTLEKAEENFQNQAEDLKKVQSERDQLREGNERMRQVIEQNDDYLGTLKREVQDEMEMLKKERDQKEKDLLTTIEQQRNQIETLKKERDEKEKENQDWSAKNEQQQNQMQALRKERDEKEKEKQDLLTKNWQQQQQVETLKKERDDTEKERLSLSARSEQQQKEITSLGQTIRSLKAKTPGDNQENCLPSQYHESIVMIVNLRSQMALDVGKDNGTKAHAWEYNVENGSQIFKLSKLSITDENSPWTISQKDDGRRLYFPNGDTDVDVHVAIGSGREAGWFIGRGASDRTGSWVIKNAHFSKYIELENGLRNNGTRAKSYNFSNNWDANWVIIPLSLSN